MKRSNCCCTKMNRSTIATLTPSPVRTTTAVSVMKRASVVVATAAMMFVVTTTTITSTNNCLLVAEAWAPSHSQQHDYHIASPVFAVKTPTRSKIPVDSSKIITNGNARSSSSKISNTNTSTNINTRLLKKKKVLKKSKIHRPVFDSAIHVHSLAASKAYKEQHNNKNNSKTFLTHKQEMEYSFQLRTFRTVMKLRESLVTYENNMYIHPTEIQLVNACGLSSTTELRQIIENGQYARNALVTSNAGLVTKLAKQFYNKLKYSIANDGVGTILTLSDMIQEGNIGLMEAVERYEPEQGYRFTTYAYYWIKQRIIRCINNTSRNIRLPIHVQETLTKIKRAKQQLIQENGGTKPTMYELAQYLNMSEEKLRLYTSTSRNVVSLERPIHTTMTSSSSSSSSPVSVGNTRSPGTSVGVVNGSNSGSDDTRTLLDTTSCDMLTPEEDLVQDSMRRDVHAVLQSELDTIEREVLLLRFGMSTNEFGVCKSVAETATILNLSRDKVRLLQARALNKLRTHNSLQGYIGGDGYNSNVANNNNGNNKNNNNNNMASLEKTFQNSPSSTSDIIRQQQDSSSKDNNNNNRPDRMWFF